jgi:Flp pilus assembly pilin Flp
MGHEKWFRGQGLAEYALIMVLIVVVIIAALAIYGNQIANFYTNIITNF